VRIESQDFNPMLEERSNVPMDQLQSAQTNHNQQSRLKQLEESDQPKHRVRLFC